MPLQGFLNAIVYGWTREEFISDIALTSHDLRTQISTETKMSTKRKPPTFKSGGDTGKTESVCDIERNSESMRITDTEATDYESEDGY